MRYISTRSEEQSYSSAEAILMGIAPDGGLLVPEDVPVLAQADIHAMMDMDYPARAAYILSLFLSDFSRAELEGYTRLAYSEEKFGEHPCPLTQLNKYNDKRFMLELWHGPTSAFKDMALQILPYLMTASAAKTGNKDEIVILTATSGDTGKAALEGFSGVEGTSVIVFYPAGGVSKAQELQMLTTKGENCSVVAINGCFDDAQRGVKEIFASAEIRDELQKRGKRLSSANSINWGRLAPQIAYYWSAYVDLLKAEAVTAEDVINFAVPTGNFGNILAAWYAKQMGLPINKLICASNKNNVLSDFLAGGRYDAKREFYKTNTPSMDILVSSNLERLLYELSYQNSSYVRERMQQLKTEGEYSVGPEMLKRLHDTFVGGFADDKAVIKTITTTYHDTDNVIDPHTAVAFNVYERYANRSKDESTVVFVSTASPFKFPAAVCKAIFDGNAHSAKDDMDLLDVLAEESGMPVPAPIAELSTLPKRDELVIDADKMAQFVLDTLQ